MMNNSRTASDNQENQVEKAKIPRRGTKHSRSGCGTCRVRRVKCDETKPGCLRCQKFRVECDGYERKPKKSSNRYMATAPALLPKLPEFEPLQQLPLMAPLFANDEDYQYFSLFVNSTIHEFVPYCPTPSYYIYSRCFITPSIRHATMALGALHKAQLAEQNHLMKNRHVTANRHHLRAIKHYANAIRTLNEELAARVLDLHGVLLSCLLAFGFEAFHGNSALAEKQILCGLSFINAWQSSHAAGQQRALGFWVSDAPDVGNDLVQFFGRLELQLGLQGRLNMFGQNVPERDGQYAIERMPALFDDLFKAQGYLHLLMKRLQFFLQSARLVNTPKNSNLIPPHSELETEEAAKKREELEAMQAVQVSDYKRWRQSFDALLFKERKRAVPNVLMTTILELHYKTNLLVLNTLLLDSMVYDTMAVEFEGIIDLAAQLISIINLRTKTSKFNFDLGSILPLYLVALRCRIRKTRDRAIALLLDHPRREGLWDSVFAGRFTRWIADQEDRERDSKGVVPSWARVRCVYSDFDLQSKSAAVRCLQSEKRGDEFVDVVRKANIMW